MIKYANVIEWNGKMSASVYKRIIVRWKWNMGKPRIFRTIIINNFRGDPATRYNDEQWISRKKEQNIYIY